ncbi:MAG: LptF/LptG family permease [Candidatus Puniceispirillaceae bacterium]
MRYAPPLLLSLYLARRYLFWILLTMGALLSFITLIDAVEYYRRLSNIDANSSTGLVIWFLLTGLPEKIDLLMPFGVLFGSILCFQNWSKTNELMVARAFGQNIWQALLPVFLTVLLVGLLQIAVLNPIKSVTLAAQNEMKAETFGTQETGQVSISASGVWLKDASNAQPLIIHGPSLQIESYTINKPIIYMLGDAGQVLQRTQADRMTLTDQGWTLSQASQSDSFGETTFLGDIVIATKITPVDFIRTTQRPDTISIYSLPNFIEILDQTGLPSGEHKVYFQQQLAIPFYLTGLSMLAACFTLLHFSRRPRYQIVAMGLGFGFAAYFIVDLIYLLGANARLPVSIAGWGPALTLCLVTGYLLARSEDR